MTYASQQDLIDRYTLKEVAALSDRDLGVNVDAGVLSRALADADSTIDGYVSARYAAPLNPVPSLINLLACQIARYFLHDSNRPETVQKDYDAAIVSLKAISRGDLVLPGAAPAEPGSAAPGGAPLFERDDPVFTDSNLGGFL